MQEPLVALLILAAAAGSFWAWLGWRRRRVRRGRSEDLVRAYDVSGTGVLVLAFTTPDCMPCKVLQRPALEDLKRQFPGLIVIGEVDALECPEFARRFGILTVPSTVVIGPAGDIRAVNHGAVTARRLASQAKLNGAWPTTQGARGDGGRGGRPRPSAQAPPPSAEASQPPRSQ